MNSAEEILRTSNAELSLAAQNTIVNDKIDFVRELEAIRQISFRNPAPSMISRVLAKMRTSEAIEFHFSRESHYRAAALLILSKFPVCIIPMALRTAPRPHGGRIWLAMADIRKSLPDDGVDRLLDQKTLTIYQGLQRFTTTQNKFTPATNAQVLAAANAWKTLILTQDDFGEAKKLVKQTVVSCSIREEILENLKLAQPKLIEVLLA